MCACVCSQLCVCPITRMFNHFYDCDKFKKAGQFSFSDIQKLSKNLKSGILPLPQLVKLLEHRNIIARISFPDSSAKESGAPLSETPQSASPTGRPSHDICKHVLETVCHTLDHVISKIKHKQYLALSSSDSPTRSPYELGFQCPEHPQEDHMAVCRPSSEQLDPSLSAANLWFDYFENNSTLLCLNENVVVTGTDPNDSWREHEDFATSPRITGVCIDKKYSLWMGPPKAGKLKFFYPLFIYTHANTIKFIHSYMYWLMLLM